MTRRLVAALAAAALVAGCGGEGSPEKDAYERGFADARKAFTERAQALDDPGRDAPAAERAAATEAAAAELGRFVAALERLEPPADVARAHADLTAAFRATAELTLASSRALREGDDEALRRLGRRLADRSPIDRRAEAAAQVLAEKGYVLDLDFDL